MRYLMISNYGYAPYTARLPINVPWLDSTTLPEGEIFEISAKKVLNLPISVNEEISSYEFGALHHKADIVLESLTENTPSFDIPTRVLVARLQLPIVAVPLVIHLGAITAGQRLPEAAMHGEFFLRNNGQIDWYIIEAVRQFNYIDFDPKLQMITRMSESEPISVRWNDEYPAPQHVVTTTVEDRITLQDDDEQTVSVRVQYDIHPAQIEMTPDYLELSLASTVGSRTIGSRRSTSTSTESNLVIHNWGGAPFWIKRRTLIVAGSDSIGNMIVPLGLQLEPPIDDGYIIPPNSDVSFKVYAPNPAEAGDGEFSIVLHLPDRDKTMLVSKINIRQ